MVLMKQCLTRSGCRRAALLAIMLAGLATNLGGPVDARRSLPTEESSQRKTVKVPKPSIIDSTEGLTIHETLIVNGLVRKALVHLPNHYNPDEKRPLLIVLHGARLSGWIAEAVTGFDKIANQEDFIVAYPDAVHQQWDDGRSPADNPSSGIDDVAFMARLIDTIDWKYHIETNEVYVAGYSSGGMLAQKVGMELSGKVSAIAEVASSLPIPQLALRKTPTRPLSVLMINGTQDRAFPMAGGTTQIIKVKVGPVAPIMTTYQYWIEANGGIGSASPREDALQKIKHGTIVNLLNTRTRNGSCVMLYAINGGGHTWPGSEVPLRYIPLLGRQSRDLNASELIWEFFKYYRRDC